MYLGLWQAEPGGLINNDMGEIGGRVANFTMVAIHLDESVGIRVPDTEQFELSCNET